MDYIDGSGFWLSATTAQGNTPPVVVTGQSIWKPIWVPRRRSWWWIVLPWLWSVI